MNNDIGAAMVSLVRDLEPGLLLVISILSWILALLCFAQGCGRALRHARDPFQAPRFGGIVLSFLLTAVFAALPSVLSAAGESLFGAGASAASVSLGYGGRAASYEQLLRAVLIIVNIAGLIAFIRGAFLLRSAADGEAGATPGKAFAHMLGGIAGWYIVYIIQAVQLSLGITVLKIT